jgi:hypothetical protein
VYNPPTHMLPPTFPLLLVVPAVCFDLALPRIERRPTWQQGLLLGVIFVLTLLAVQWPFAGFMLSPGARNAFFVADRWDYSAHLGPWRHEYWSLEVDSDGHWNPLRFWSGIAFAVPVAALSSWIGVSRGRWMRGVQR